MKVTVPSTDGAADEYYADSSATTHLDPPLPAPAMESEHLPRVTESSQTYLMDRFGSDAAFAPNPALVPNDPSIYQPPGSEPLPKRSTLKDMYRKAREGKGSKESRSEVKEAKKKVKAEKKEERRKRTLQAIETHKRQKAEEKQAHVQAKHDKALAAKNQPKGDKVDDAKKKKFVSSNSSSDNPAVDVSAAVYTIAPVAGGGDCGGGGCGCG
ncbi:hypothetical protein BLS_004533 [Venturia inaequalis]|uniref:Uncharacterized protein n=1 Tax=Venturia inaequalis TaxID=5025 RepID=A0A8H3ZHW1_VENIN|nr:hypothetical protein EG328_010237 [Venturia inaequalis]KAE9985853.1 hypothetical protein BLS_004533 [Venturia inaequalis]KAE9994017.1 hypothetical protein EG327_001750 [Venturia inaequalis]